VRWGGWQHDEVFSSGRDPWLSGGITWLTGSVGGAHVRLVQLANVECVNSVTSIYASENERHYTVFECINEA
jgi:hypothetical protein